MGRRSNRGKRLVQPAIVARLALGKDRGERIGAGGGGRGGEEPRLEGLVGAQSRIIRPWWRQSTRVQAGTRS